MSELFRHIGPNTDVPAEDIGVGAREIGYLFGMYKKLRNEFTGVLTGKSLGWGGSLIRPEAIDIFLDNKILYAPGKAANVGGVFVSGLEMTQNSMRLSWTKKEVDNHLKFIKKRIHQSCLDTSVEYGAPGNYVVGANIAGFVKVVDAMLDQGLV